ncbi:FecR family protein [Roseivirga sp.]|uniref:FecR family protein n=1 Tax=Roseivirga sp. TaxID=1964215 RepID=UPI002B2683B0|nr:FecR domain-containing protein [Roseivirga sp.]
MKDKKSTSSFLSGNSTDEQKKALHDWLIENENSELTDEFFESAWINTYKKDIHNIDKTSIFDKISQEVSLEEKLARPPKNQVLHRYKKRGVLPAFTIGLNLIIALTLGYFLSIPNQSPSTQYELAQITKQTQRGYRSSFTLKDGTKVTLNSESKLVYDESYGFDQRIVHLEGEAFFEVAEDTTRPFKVISKSLTTVALGTAFNVRDYSDEDDASIALTKGKVKVNGTNQSPNTEKQSPFILAPSELITFDKNDMMLVKGNFEPKKLLSWKDEVIYFNDTKLSDIIKTLERWYDVNIILKGNAPNKLKLEGTGEFSRQSLESVLNTLGYTMGFSTEINQKQILIKLTDN